MKKIEVSDVGRGEDSISVIKQVETKELGFGIDVVFVNKPRLYIAEALRNKDWFKGIVSSATFFEHFGLEKLRKHFKGKISPERLDKLSLESIITLLFGCGIIDQPTYTRMIDVKDRRNDLVHKPWANVVINDKEGKMIIEKALKCLEAIGV